MPGARFGRLGSAAMILPIVLSKRLRRSGELERPDARRDETPQSRGRTCAVFGNRARFTHMQVKCGAWGPARPPLCAGRGVEMRQRRRKLGRSARVRRAQVSAAVWSTL